MKQAIMAALLALAAAGAQAQVTVKDAWVRATVPAAKSGGAYLQLQSAQDARLVGVRSSVAGVAELHEMAMDGQTMKMRAVTGGIDLPAGKPVALDGGYHIMLMDLKRQLKEGETVPLTLLIEGKDKKQQAVEVQAQVKPLSYSAPKH